MSAITTNNVDYIKAECTVEDGSYASLYSGADDDFLFVGAMGGDSPDHEGGASINREQVVALRDFMTAWLARRPA